jgi:uncharacterized repeat protein (TIGR03803 family)
MFPSCRRCFSLVIVALGLTLSPSAFGQTLNVLYNFSGGSDGSGPNRSLVFDSSGNLYGTTFTGGIGFNGGNGVAFELSPSGGGTWTETVLYSFQGGADGYNPFGGVIFDAAGNLYGTTDFGGSVGEGTVYELSPAGGGTWTHTVLHSFSGGRDGQNPQYALVSDAAGNLYGSTIGAGSLNRGTVFEMSPTAGGGWTETTIQNLPGTSNGPLAIDSHGNLYGVTLAGGTGGADSVFELSLTAGGWRLHTLYNFLGGSDGFDPAGGVVWTPNGHLYGVTQQGGTKGDGTFYELTPGTGGAWTKTFTYSFGTKRADPTGPTSGPIAQGLKSFWGGSTSGSTSGCGGIFNLTLGSSGWHERNPYEATCVGDSVLGASVLDSVGDVFGVGAGGTHGAGFIFEFVK